MLTSSPHRAGGARKRSLARRLHQQDAAPLDSSQGVRSARAASKGLGVNPASKLGVNPASELGVNLASDLSSDIISGWIQGLSANRTAGGH